MAKYTSESSKTLIHTVVVPADYHPPHDVAARMAAWLVRETSLYLERTLLNFWIPLSEAQGRRMFGGNWYKAVTSAVTSGLAERHRSYSTGIGYENKSFPKAIRLHECHKSAGVRQFKLKRAITKKTNYSLSPVGTWLAQWLPEFDLPNDIRPRNLWEAYHIETVRSKQFYATQCEHGRFHSNFTTTTKQHRNRITHSNTQLARLDIQCSQPTLLDALVFSGNKDSSHMICHTSSDLYELLLPIARQCDEYCDVKQKSPVPSSSPNQQQITLWRQQVPSQWQRNDVKVNLLKAIFSKNHIMAKQPAFIALKKLFPRHAAYIKEVKRNNHRLLAQCLQQLEAAIMIQGVCGRLSNDHPDVPVLTIHDELIVPQNMSDLVRGYIQTEFEKHGVVAKVTQENLS